jgi:uncharacterized membrane protein
MIVALPLHILAIVVWLGGLFCMSVMVSPAGRDLDATAIAFHWQRVLARFFTWAWIALLLIVATGIALVQVRFGGFSNMPALHRANTAIGVPAIALFAYVFLVPWRRYCRSIAKSEWSAAERLLGHVRIVLAIILVLGVVASVISIVDRL